MQVDYIIVGQGLCGSLLGLDLIKHGGKIVVIDDLSLPAASKVASGIINPVTGKRLVRSWMTEQLVPFARNQYHDLGRRWDKTLLQPLKILDFHLTGEMKTLFDEKLETEKDYLHHEDNEMEWGKYFRYNYGIGVVSPCYLLDMHALLLCSREELKEDGALLEEKFNWDYFEQNDDQIRYQNITAEKIIFCDGVSGVENPYFNMLPWSKDKGEALIASIPGLPRDTIFRQGINIVPWADDLFWIGASHDWKFTDLSPGSQFRKQVEDHLNYWLKLPYEIVDHLVAQRPANLERKPFVGLHPKYNTIGILNGMGSKGCSMAPYFAHQFTHHLINGSPILPDVDVKRFERILSR